MRRGARLEIIAAKAQVLIAAEVVNGLSNSFPSEGCADTIIRASLCLVIILFMERYYMKINECPFRSAANTADTECSKNCALAVEYSDQPGDWECVFMQIARALETIGREFKTSR
jgi:hypothetical protein